MFQRACNINAILSSVLFSLCYLHKYRLFVINILISVFLYFKVGHTFY